MDREYFENYKPNFKDGILREHNVPVYEKILQGLSKRNKVLFEQATGTGKTYLALKFLYDHAKGKKVLFVSPSDSIDMYFVDAMVGTLLDIDDDIVVKLSKKQKLELIKDFLDIDFNSCLYQGLKGVQDNQYGIIIFDEAHRMGAKTWGPNAEKLINNNPDANIIGMTATLERTDGVDVKKYFDGKAPVSRMTLIDALKKGILPSFDYKLGKISFEEESKFVEDSTKDFNEKLKTAEGEERKEILEFLDKLKQAQKAISGSKEIPTIFKESINTEELKKGKFIVFCPPGEDMDEDENSIHRMQAIMEQAPSWFSEVHGLKGIKTYSVYGKEGASKNRQTIKAFESDDSDSLKLLFSINMLNEGLHVDDIDGVIMLRSTSSRIIYLQQLGRALSVGHNQNPKIFDFVANLSYVDVQEITGIAKSVNGGSNPDGEIVDFDGKTDIQEKEIFNLEIENLEELQFIEKLKSNIYAFNHRNDFEFEDFYKRLKEYKEEFGDCLVRRWYRCKDNYTLGQKVNSIRTKYILLDDDQMQRLSDLGFVWKAAGFGEDGIRTAVKLFVKEYLEYMSDSNNNKLSSRSVGEKEQSLYARWRKYTNPENLSEEEIDFIQSNGITLRYKQEITDNVRVCVKEFAKEYLQFIATYSRQPMQSSDDVQERSLYSRWTRFTNARKVNEDEASYLQEQGIIVRNPYDRVRIVIKKFATDYVRFVTENSRKPRGFNASKKEINLYSRYLRFRNTKNLNNEEIAYLQKEGVELVDEEGLPENVRMSVCKFVKDYIALVKKPDKQDSLYERWATYTNSKNLTQEEILYIQKHGIEIRFVQETDNIRIVIKKFVKDYLEFILTNSRMPKWDVSKEETSLYEKWKKYTKKKNLNNEEIQYLRENGIEIRDDEANKSAQDINDNESEIE